MKGDFYLGEWLVQPSLGRVCLDDHTVQVRPKVMDLLVYLAGSPGAVISKDTLLNDVWGTEAISESALTRTITELRTAVGDDVNDPRFLETIPKRGYRLIAPVRPAVPPEPGQPSRRRAPRMAMSSVAVLAVGMLALFWFRMPRSAEEPVVRVRPLTTLNGEEGQPSFSPDGSRIAFSWSGSANDNLDVYVKRLGDDQSPVRLTTDPEPEGSPAWSPDGRAIAFVRASNRSVAVHVTSLTGAERTVATLRRTFTAFRVPMLEWTGDGSALLVVDQDSSTDPFHVARIALDSGETRQITSPPPQSLGDSQLAVSPNGQTLAFTRILTPGTSDIYLVPIAGGEPRRLTFDNSAITGLTWAEDGRAIVFSSERSGLAGAGSLWRVRIGHPTARNEPEQLAGIGHRAIAPAVARRGGLLAYQEYLQDTNVWRASTTGGEPPRPLIASTREETSPDYSPDGARVAFASTQSGNWEVWSANADGSNPRQITSFRAAPCWTPRWSPDGRRLAFEHSANGNADIYTISPEGTSLRQLTMDRAQDITPSWSPDGRSMYFSSNRTGSFEIWKMDLNRDHVVQITRKGGTNPRELAGSNRLFYIKRGESGLELWSAGINGGEEIRVLGPMQSAAGWVPARDGIYFIEPALRISFFRFAGGVAELIATMPKNSGIAGAGLTLSPDGRWLLYSQKDRTSSDIMLVENFR